MAKLHDYYKDEVVNKLMTEFNYNSVMQVPRVEKITLNMGVGEAIADKKLLDNAAADLTVNFFFFFFLLYLLEPSAGSWCAPLPPSAYITYHADAAVGGQRCPSAA